MSYAHLATEIEPLCTVKQGHFPVSESGLQHPGARRPAGPSGRACYSLSQPAGAGGPGIPLLTQFHGSRPPPVAFENIRCLVTTLLKMLKPVTNTLRLRGSKNVVKNCNVIK